MTERQGRTVGATRNWTEDDDALLLELAKEHTPRAQMANMLQRPIGAVSSRLYKLRMQEKRNATRGAYSPVMGDRDRRASHGAKNREFVGLMFAAGYGHRYDPEFDRHGG